MRKLLLMVFVVTTLCLVSSGAVADECKQVFARGGGGDFYSGCSYDGVEYLWCADIPMQGNLRGTWHIYSSPEWNGWETLTVPDDALGIDGWDVWGFWNLSVFETKHGELLTQGNDFLNLNAYFTYGVFSSTFFVIDGKGEFEGATGWLGGVGNELTGLGILWGEVCTP